MDNNIKVIFIIALIIAGTIGYYAWQKSEKPAAAVCTTEAKICPDGSVVGRAGPGCEFSPCPNQSSLKTFTDNNSGLFFQYPENLGIQYISTVDWPPLMTIESGKFTCNEAGSIDSPAGETKKYNINGHNYCVTRKSEGSAGGVYNLYAYAFPKQMQGDEKIIILTFSLRFDQCGNYGEPQRTACQREQSSFDIGRIIDSIADSLKPVPQNSQIKKMNGPD